MTAAEVLAVKEDRGEQRVGLSTGSTLLNLACTDKTDTGLLSGGYYYLVGDSVSGKTWLSLSCFAEACRNPAFENYRLIYDDVEGGALMDVEFYFGKAVAERLEPPARLQGEPVYSDTVESFYFHLHDALKQGRPFIYVLDSQDALSSGEAAKKFEQQREAAQKGTEVAGSYGDGKAKYHSQHLRHVLQGIRKTGSILIVIGQTRDALGMMGFATKTRAGGRALRFYANLEIWTSVAGKIKRLIRGKERTVGVRCLAEVKKNRVTGKIGPDRSVEFPIFFRYGIDDLGSCVDYLVAEGRWSREGKMIHAGELGFRGSKEKLISLVEEQGKEEEVRRLVGEVWNEVEAELAPRRKRRYE